MSEVFEKITKEINSDILNEIMYNFYYFLSNSSNVGPETKPGKNEKHAKIFLFVNVKKIHIFLVQKNKNDMLFIKAISILCPLKINMDARIQI